MVVIEACAPVGIVSAPVVVTVRAVRVRRGVLGPVCRAAADLDDVHMLAFLVPALVVAAQPTAGRVSLDYVSRGLLAHGLLLVKRARVLVRWRRVPAAGRACPDGSAGSACPDGCTVRSLLARVMILAKRVIGAMHPATSIQNWLNMLRRGSQTGLRRGSGRCSQRKVGGLHVEAGETPRFAQIYER
ncbi:hypothetical protein T492DRAFT_873827 [Pavlovales sp. CCMP2436]|nr:hypothetical protein T492DRAFT_873827 [Pavlovales sp. CCMP2436]